MQVQRQWNKIYFLEHAHKMLFSPLLIWCKPVVCVGFEAGLFDSSWTPTELGNNSLKPRKLYMEKHINEIKELDFKSFPIQFWQFYICEEASRNNPTCIIHNFCVETSIIVKRSTIFQAFKRYFRFYNWFLIFILIMSCGLNQSWM